MCSDRNKLQEAVGLIADELSELAKGSEKPPEVSFDVEWIDISTMDGGYAWHPQITITATAVHTIYTDQL